MAPGVFSIDTDNGQCVQVYSLEERTEDVPPGDELLDERSIIHHQSVWEGDVFMTTTKNSDGRRFLNFSSPIDWNLVVEREYRPTNARSIKCAEVFVRSLGQVSPLQCVPGCVTNVQVRTMVVDNGLVLDGEADAVIS